MSNFRGPDGKLYFDGGSIGWRASLVRVLGGQKSLLSGVFVVSTSSDSRLCIACRTREARGALFAALRGKSDVRVSPQFDEVALRNKRMAAAFARQEGLRIDDRGDYVGFWGPRGRAFGQ